jgi:hypothetical protein
MIQTRTDRTGRKRFVLWASFAAALALTAAAFGEGGNTPGEGLLIEGLPFADSGDTSDDANIGNPSCAEPGSPDVWYQIIPEEDIQVTFSLCGSFYDTVLWVLDEGLQEIDCNNDACDLQSELVCVQLEAGKVHYIGVDGNDGAAGPYQFTASVCLPPLPCHECLQGSLMEGEPTCYDDYEDNYNGGCNSSPPIFQPIMSGETVCGESGVYEVTRELWSDTDWYELHLGGRRRVPPVPDHLGRQRGMRRHVLPRLEGHQRHLREPDGERLRRPSGHLLAVGRPVDAEPGLPLRLTLQRARHLHPDRPLRSGVRSGGH